MLPEYAHPVLHVGHQPTIETVTQQSENINLRDRTQANTHYHARGAGCRDEEGSPSDIGEPI
jgi:hypothetical protein